MSSIKQAREQELVARLSSSDPKEVKKEKARQRKRKQRGAESLETLEQTHRRRQDLQQVQHQRAFGKLRARQDTIRTRLDSAFEGRLQKLVEKPSHSKVQVDTLRARRLKNLQKRTAIVARQTKRLDKSQRGKKDTLVQKQIGQRRRKTKEPTKPFELQRARTKFARKFNTNHDEFVVKVNSENINVADVFVEALMDVIGTRGLVSGDRVRMVLNHETWSKPISVKLTRIPNGDLRPFLYDLIKRLLEFAEYKGVSLNELVITISSIVMPRGSGRLKPTKENIVKKRSIVSIKSSDTMCQARAIVTALANIQKDEWSLSDVKNGFNASRKLQGDEARRLHESAGVEISDVGSDLEDCLTFAEHLGVQINVIDGDFLDTLIFSGGPKDSGMIYLYKRGNHFDVIKSMPGFLCKDYFCHTCKVPYCDRDKHRCPFKCVACMNSKCCQSGKQDIVCQDCNRAFFGPKCFDEHKRVRGVSKGKPDAVCSVVQKCVTCKRTVKSLKTHVCGFSECSNCKLYCDRDEHRCHMRKLWCKGGECTRETSCGESLEKKKWCYACKTRTEKYAFYDFETSQDTGVHIVNYACLWDFDGSKRVFTNIEDFCEFALKLKGYTLVAHNAKAFDSQFVLKYCIENGVKPYVIYNGTKVMFMSVGASKTRIRFIDSINFVNSKLSDFPETFGLSELKKGFFPHYFNKPCNQNYVGPMPSRKHYGPDQMSSECHGKFLEWYQDRVDESYVFDFEKELREYCESDVDILRRSMIEFRKDFIELENIDPLQYITIASVCVTVYRCNYMPEESIAVVRDIAGTESFSEISVNWLRFVAETSKTHVEHAVNGGERSIEGVGKVDGYCKATNTVYEFQGCFWHGCTKCFSADTINNKNQLDMGELQSRTTTRNKKIRDLGYNLVEMYECDLKKDRKFKSWSKKTDTTVVTPLNPRDAFFGGRTNITKLKYVFGRNEKGRYVDYVSLYPTVQFFKDYPVGHPTTIHNPEIYDESWFGIVKCRVAPPRDLYHPVLPVITNCGKDKKLVFSLCKSCAESQSQTKCCHTACERSFVGSWCTMEVERAIEKGYTVDKVYEVLNFEKRSSGLFKDYVRRFMKIKLESTKPPKTGPNEKYESIDHFKGTVKEKLGVELGKVELNPGMRAIAKMCLNSLWGKFGQRTNLRQTTYVNTLREFYDIILNEKLDNLDVHFINDEIVQMSYTAKDKFKDNENNINIFIAAFTTSHARMMLYDVVDKLGDRVLGYDTDSCWYVEKPGDTPIETGDSLGDLTDELGGGHITDWSATGPKSYAYKINTGESVCKVKGFTLNHENSKYINLDVMSDMVDGEKDRVTTVRESAITRNALTRELVNKYQEKDFKLNYNKRIVQSNLDTLPYGY